MDLTPSQNKAINYLEGPLLVLAGPGSGKTRVITQRIARLIESGVPPREILAITFTNKAAKEMAVRVESASPGNRVWVSTFHRFCARLLRSHASSVGLEAGYSIFDTTDQMQIIRQVLQDQDLDPVHCPPAKISAMISRAKNDLITADDYANGFNESVGDLLQAAVARVYPDYQRLLLKSNAVDFDDLLLHVVTLLTDHPELRHDLDDRFRYVLVDEYQDTNRAQYEIVKALSQNTPNLCATGDPDQSIYGWRGARIDNILQFEADYPNAQVVRLEENFRSTKKILQSADRLIAHNKYRKAKSLVTENTEGEPVALLLFRDSKHEADSIARQIRQQFETGEKKWSDFALFYRVNSLSRELELALSRHRIPYQVAAGVAFYERAEVKDMIGYLRLIHNPSDRAAFQRIINKPLRGIGKTTQNRLMNWADSIGIGFLEAARRATEIPKLSKRAINALKIFTNILDGVSLADEGSVGDLLTKVIETTNYTRQWQGNQTEQDTQKLANVNELVSAARQYDDTYGEERSLEGFLETASLAATVDNVDESAGKVTLMTLHAAKGLEFPVVYIIAVEEELLPHERAIRANDQRELEEERRLLFVGMTRAMKQLYLTTAIQREVRGRPLHTIPSDFLGEAVLVHKDLTIENPDETLILDIAATPNKQKASDNSQLIKLKQKIAGSPKLMTGMSLLNGTHNAAEVPQGFTIGMTVRHPRYGLGKVIDVSGYAKKRTLTVEFHDEERTETFIAAKCPLQPVGIL